MENNGLVALKGGKAKTKTYFINGELFNERCKWCNQLKGKEYNDICYGKGMVPYLSRQAYERDVRLIGVGNNPLPEEPPFHEFELLPPIHLDVPLTLRNQSYARYSYTRTFNKQGLRVFVYSGERGMRLTPKELEEVER